MKKKYDHVHKYKKVLLSERTGSKVFKCQIPGCTRYLPRDLVVGEKSICWKCEKELVLTKENTTLVKPTCLSCRGEKFEGEVIPSEVLSTVRKFKEEKEDVVDGILKSLGLGY